MAKKYLQKSQLPTAKNQKMEIVQSSAVDPYNLWPRQLLK